MNTPMRRSAGGSCEFRHRLGARIYPTFKAACAVLNRKGSFGELSANPEPPRNSKISHLGLARDASYGNLLLRTIRFNQCARVAELADALDSGSSE